MKPYTPDELGRLAVELLRLRLIDAKITGRLFATVEKMIETERKEGA